MKYKIYLKLYSNDDNNYFQSHNDIIIFNYNDINLAGIFSL